MSDRSTLANSRPGIATRVIVLVGLPAAGKSKASTSLASQYDSVIVSTDELRERRFGIQFNEEIKELIFTELIDTVASYLLKGTNVVVDTTFLNEVAGRRKFLFELRQHTIGNANEIEKIAIYFDVDINTCLSRDSKRKGGRVVGEKVIRRQSQMISVPVKNEGWDAVVTSSALHLD